MLKFLCLVVFVAGASASDFFLNSISTFDKRIFGGNEATHGQFPYQVSLRGRGKNGLFHFCGGSIISNRFVLTAAHCTQGKMSRPHFVRAVVGALTRNGTDGIHYTLDSILSHPNFDRNTLANDIAVVRTVNQIKYSNDVQPIALPTTEVLIEGNVPATVSGWGQSMVRSLTFYSLIRSN